MKKNIPKPRQDTYKKILQLTQSIGYTPQKAEWFCGALGVKEKNVISALDYLCQTNKLKVTDMGYYVASVDLRLRVKGIYHTDGRNGHIHADAQRRINHEIYVPNLRSMGAQHNDRVEVAIEGMDESLKAGVVNKIINTWGNYAVGKMFYIDGEWFFKPENKALGGYIPVSNDVSWAESNLGVYVKLDYAEKEREIGKTKSDIRQKKDTIVWDEVNSGERIKSETMTEHTCTLLCPLYDEQTYFAYKYRFKGAEEKKKFRKRSGKPPLRVDLTEQKCGIRSDQQAFFSQKTGDELKIFSHIADVTEYIPLNSDIELDMLKFYSKPDLIPKNIRSICAFSENNQQNAITVEITVNKNDEITDTKIYRSVICPKGKTKSDFEKLTNNAVAQWFDENKIAAPFLHIQRIDAKEPDYHILKSDKEDAARIAADTVPQYNFTIDFCRPFENYLSYLSNVCFTETVNIRNKGKESKIADIIREKCALSNERRASVKCYETILDNISACSQLNTSDLYDAIYVSKRCDGKHLIYTHGIYGLCNMKSEHKESDTIKVRYIDCSIDRLNVYFKEI